MKDNVVSSIWVATQLDTSQFKKSLREVDQELQLSMKKFDNYEKTTYSTSRTFDAMGDSAQSLRQSMGEVGDSAQKASNGMDKFGEAAKEADTPLDELNDDLKKTKEGMEDLGNQTKKTKSKMEELEGFISGKLAKALSVAGIVGAIAGVGKALLDAQKVAVETDNKFKTLYGDINQTAKAYAEFQASKRYLSGGEEEQKIKVAEAVNLEFGDLTASYKQALQQEILSISGALGLNGEQLAFDLSEIASKWNISNDKLIETLQTMKNVAMQQTGPKAENFAQNIDVLKNYDKAYMAAGFDFDKLLVFLQTLDSKTYNKNVIDTSELINKEYIKGMTEIAEAQKKTPELEKTLASTNAELTAQYKLLEEYSKNPEKNYSKLESITSKIDELKTKIADITAELKTTKETASTSPDDLMKNLFAKESLDLSDVSMRGDLKEFLEVAKILTDVLKNQSATDMLQRGTGEVTPVSESILESFHKAWTGAFDDFANNLFQTDVYQQATKERTSAMEDFYSSLSKYLDAKYPEYATWRKENPMYTDWGSDYMKEYKYYTSLSNQLDIDKNTELIQEYADTFKKATENLSIYGESSNTNIGLLIESNNKLRDSIDKSLEKPDKFQIDVKVTTDNSFINASASLHELKGNQASLTSW